MGFSDPAELVFKYDNFSAGSGGTDSDDSTADAESNDASQDASESNNGTDTGEAVDGNGEGSTGAGDNSTTKNGQNKIGDWYFAV